jgi:anti-sigma regulatory factor (Ser/Thr protein kinase)
MPLLAGEGVGAGEIEDIIAQHGFASARSAGEADVIVVAHPDREALERLLAAGAPHAIIESPVRASDFGPRLQKAVERKGLYLSLSTGQAFNADLTSLLCNSCAKRLNLSEERRLDIETAIEEALSNAMVHGNLDIASVLRNDPADFDLYCDLVNERLGDPKYAERRLEILVVWNAKEIDIEVHDEGRGYDVAASKALPHLEAKCGRGFTLIRDLANNVTIGEHGRSLTMSFSP